MTRYKVFFKKKPDGIKRTSYGYYVDEEDWKSRNSTYIFIKLTNIAEKVKPPKVEE